MYETRPRSSDELEPVKVNVKTLTREFQSSLRSLFEGELKRLVVDVSSRPTLEPTPVWRINIPPKTPHLYVAISELCAQANGYYREFVKLGTMEPREFIVSVWFLLDSEQAIKGSFD